jgi:hypothetical protein
MNEKAIVEITIDPETMETKIENKGGGVSSSDIKKIRDSLGVTEREEVTCQASEAYQTTSNKIKAETGI